MDIFNHKHHKALLMRILVPLILAPLSLALKAIGTAHGVLSAAAVLLLIATPPSPPRTTPLFSNTTLFVICYALCAAYLSASAAEILPVCAMLIAAGYISAKIRMQMESEHRKNISSAERTARLNELNALLLAAHSTDEILDLVLGFMHRVSGRSIILFETSRSIRRISAAPQGVIIYGLDTAAITQAANTQRICGKGSAVCPGSVYRCYPVPLGKDIGGVIAIVFGTEECEADMIAFMDQLMQRASIALDSQRLIDTSQQISIEKQLEHMRSNFLRAISHDLRSPLAAIAAACCALEQTPDMSEGNLRLISDIQEESEWLTQMVENLLSVTRLDTGCPKLNFTSEAIEEIVGEAAYKCRTRFPELKLEVKVPDEVIILQMDAMLITQVILNLVENALKYGGESKRVLITVSRGEREALLTVRDHGMGILPEKQDTLFSGRAIPRDDSRHGLGIGLSICKTIVNAHHGRIWAENCADGGAEFNFTLPLEETDG